MTSPADHQRRQEAIRRVLETALGRPLREREQEMVDLVPADTVTESDWAVAAAGGATTFEDLVTAAFSSALVGEQDGNSRPA